MTRGSNELKYFSGDVAAQDAQVVQAPPKFVCANCSKENAVSNVALRRLRGQVAVGETANIQYSQKCWNCKNTNHFQLTRTMDAEDKEKIDVLPQRHPG